MSLFGSQAQSTSTITSVGTENDLANDCVLTSPPEDSISDMAFSPQSDLIAVASWDKKVRIYEVAPTGENQGRTIYQSQGRALYDHQAPVLSVHWSPDGSKVASGGADKAGRVYDLQTGQSAQVAAHDATISSVRWVDIGPSQGPMIATASWDKTLKYWDLRQQNAISTVQLPERAYSMDSQKQLLVVGTAERQICVIDLSNPQTIFKRIDSPLKWQTKVITCYPTGDGYAIGSIEGRCALQYVDAAQQSAKGFSFKCHRTTVPNRNESQVFAVNAISFHPIYGTFSTAGADGCFNFWDKEAKHRLKGWPSRQATISSTAFNRNGTIFAYALSYDWSKGYQFNTPEYPNIVRFHNATDDETKQRKKTR
ncbi:WD40 repeat-like protein [Nadsonia fulvescens var. elongata DSM 6958]|uniref:WD40 repeat-like protein n=1 Tax=Nadsonia fulvescens var. elongata DSM 6958 TaxID=857566 RepID=A0A1E3PEE6_9ASCO|nr:WD40 repeat-like protein [Nadsonia fulvescens var. elongata DSM 6958]